MVPGFFFFRSYDQRWPYRQVGGCRLAGAAELELNVQSFEVSLGHIFFFFARLFEQFFGDALWYFFVG